MNFQNSFINLNTLVLQGMRIKNWIYISTYLKKEYNLRNSLKHGKIALYFVYNKSLVITI
ncbi:hypothetical protein GCM10008921_27600 [Metaclostridioides mangenotii]